MSTSDIVIYYTGTEEQWAAIQFRTWNEDFEIHYNHVPET